MTNKIKELFKVLTGIKKDQNTFYTLYFDYLTEYKQLNLFKRTFIIYKDNL